MTTTSNNRKRRKVSLRTAAFLILITVLLCAGLLWRDAAANILWRFLSPALSVRNEAAAGSTGFFGQFKANGALAAENAQLKEALASTSARLIDRDFLYAENQELKRELGRTVKDASVLAAVLLRPPGIPYGTLMLDVGRDNGVRDGDLVSSSGSAYIGRITVAYDTTSRVTLFSAPGQTYQGMLRGTIPVSISGEGGASLTGEVPAGIEVKSGDPVLLSGIMPQFAALVSSVVKPEGQSFQSIYLSLPANPLELRYVFVHFSH